MAQVSLQVNGYGYVLGCSDGEEERLLALAADLDRRIEDIKAASGPSGEARMLLMAALLISDEYHELLEGGPAVAKPEPKVSRRLRGLAKRAEAIADRTDPAPLADPTGHSAEPG
jgi:cell division protein ZapA